MLFVALCFLILIACCTASLQLVHVVFRHGERSPSRAYYTDPHANFSWDQGWGGQLTANGKRQMYRLGQVLADRYRKLDVAGATVVTQHTSSASRPSLLGLDCPRVSAGPGFSDDWDLDDGEHDHFLPETYHPDDALMLSSYADRCQMSAQLVLAGLYPPRGRDVWNAQLKWQPIPVQVLPRHLDNILAMKQPCARFAKLFHEAEAEATRDLAKAISVPVNLPQLYDYLTRHTGQPVDNLRSVESLYNVLSIEQDQGLILPAWTADVFPQPMLQVATLNLALYTWTDHIKRLHGGPLLKEVFEHAQSKSKQKLQPNRKMFLYSAHDLTILTLLRILSKEHEFIKPAFGATLIFETHEDNNSTVIKAFYLADPMGQAEEINICGDPAPCELHQIAKSLQNVLPENWDQECADS